MEEEKKPVTEVGDLIDLTPTALITYANDISFAECNGDIKLMEMELANILAKRREVEPLVKLGFMLQETLVDYITSFVVEQKILDRLDILNSVKIAKGVSPVVFEASTNC